MSDLGATMKKANKEKQNALVYQWIDRGGDFADTAVKTVFEFLHATEHEIEERVGATLDLVESWQQSGLRLLRQANTSTGKLTVKALDGTEQGLADLVGHLRQGTEDAAHVVLRPLEERSEKRKKKPASVQAA